MSASSMQAIRAHMKQTLGDDEEFIQEVVREFIGNALLIVHAIGIELDKSDAIAVRAKAHALKGSCRTVGADAMAAIAAEIEKAGISGDLSPCSGLLAGLIGQYLSLNAEFGAETTRQAA